MNRLFRALMFLVIIGGIIVGGASELLRSEIARAADPTSDEVVEFVVEPGQSVSEIAANLKRAGLIRQPLLFRLMASRQQASANLQAGTYQLTPSMTMAQIIAALQSAPSSEEVQITIIPGMRMEEVAEVMVQAGLVDDPEAFLAVARDAMPFKENHALLESIPEGQGLEGYLFPDTYRVEATATVTEVIEKILTEGFDANFSTFETEIIAEGPDGNPPTVHQIVTMASIVQREAANNEEMPHLAYIFWNRLKPEHADEVAGRLQADPTLQYALGEPGNWWPKLDELTTEEINNNTHPYNTRYIQGLPPGPIANPGLQALRAAARPGALRPDGSDGSDDLYFVAKCGEPGHAFAATLAEFQQLEQAYLNCPSR
ncbi:endolytic transglycosylase MltG [Kallotenue papyrolyticum]|uniref:endolytic transglycosylase MltG n=1 Tax=Kallotenue papyrolyticum TaxID=1325125 RepID=UPI000478613F|nr:endolytic transglycosylase MltG [Kallotenue papyrolyticum]